uniref:Uncharacterized protein n=1 Tax=Populus trichocarpa TaxID=3694 RepID=A0A2K1ZZY7_POPTR
MLVHTRIRYNLIISTLSSQVQPRYYRQQGKEEINKQTITSAKLPVFISFFMDKLLIIYKFHFCSSKG